MPLHDIIRNYPPASVTIATSDSPLDVSELHGSGKENFTLLGENIPYVSGTKILNVATNEDGEEVACLYLFTEKVTIIPCSNFLLIILF